jgi:predicted alpha/beta hydrolase family esterase
MQINSLSKFKKLLPHNIQFEQTRNLIHATAKEINAIYQAVRLFHFTLSRRYLAPKGNPEGRPILLINGYLSFASTWHYQRQKLIEAGFGPIYSMNIGSFDSIEEYAKQIQAKVAEIKKETGRNDLAFICHSKGGLVASYYATHLADEDEVDVTDVITIGSPLAGTPIAKLGIGKDAKQMTPNHPFHKQLRQAIKDHPQIRFFHIASKADIVVPYHSSLMGDNPSRWLVLEDVGHISLVFSSIVADQIKTWLSNPTE